MKVTIVGAGYVGLGTGLALALTGHHVRFLDTNEDRVTLLRKGIAPFFEPGLEEALKATRSFTRFGTDYRRALADAEVAVLAVGTPSAADGAADLTDFFEAVRRLGDAGGVRPPLVAVKSTVPVGTTREVLRMLGGSPGRRRPDIIWSVAANPEFLRQGHVILDSLYPARIVIGAFDTRAADILERLYGRIIARDFRWPSFADTPPAPGLRSAHGEPPRPGPVPVFRMSPENAELAKYAVNAFLAAKVSLINEIANIAEGVGADVTEVARVVGSDPRVGPHFLEAGLGFGGRCLPKDLLALCRLAERVGYNPRLLHAVGMVNDGQRERVVERLESLLGGLEGAEVAILGLAFKPGTADLGQSPSLDLVERLVEKGALVRAHDPVAVAGGRDEVSDSGRVRFCGSVSEALCGADAALLATAWPEYRDFDWPAVRAKMRRPVVLDGRNFLSPARLVQAGFVYRGIGRGEE